MKNKIIYIFILLLINTFTQYGCTNSIDFQNINSNNDPYNHIVSPYPEYLMKDVGLYFAYTDDVNLHRENVTLSYKVGELEKSILTALKKGPSDRDEFSNTLAPHIDSIGVDIVENAAFVNLSSNNLFGGIKEESILLASIVKSLTE